MSFKIASLIAEIGANTSGLENGLNRAQSLLESSAKKMEQLGSNLGSKLLDPARATEAIGQFSAVAGGAVSVLTALGLVGKQYYAIAKDSAQLDYSRQKFDALSESIGSTSDYLLNDMRRATRGLYSDAQLVEQGGAMMALGLANTHEEAVRLTRVAGALNMNMDQLVLTLTNQTTRRFDSLGVSTDGFKQRLQSLEQQGYDTDKAFKEAFLQQAEEQVRRVGDVADSGYGSFMRFESSLDNFTNSMKRGREDALLPYLRTFTQLFNIQSRAYELMESGENTYYRSAAAQAAVESGRRGVEKRPEFGRAGDDIYSGTSKASIGLQNVANDMGIVLDLGLKLTGVTEDYNNKLSDLSVKLEDASQKYGEYGQKTNDVRGQIQALGAAHATAFETMALKTLEQKDASEMMMLDYARASGLITQQGYDQAVMMDKLSQAYVDGRMTAGQYANAVGGISSMVAGLDGKRADVFIDIYIREHGGSSYVSGPNVTTSGNYNINTRTVKGTNQEVRRAAGGPVSAGNMYQVNESGSPEMLTIGGRDYLMMGRQSGYVHASDTERGGQGGGNISALVAAIPSATDNAKAIARELMKFWS